MLSNNRGNARVLLILLILLGAFLYWLALPPALEDQPIPTGEEAIRQGEYLVFAGGCISCHENPDQEGTLSGGLALESEFGTFYVPNITPDPQTGVGGWSGRDFLAALKHGRDPSGGFYYPAFPYLSYRGMSDADALAIAAYLNTLAPVSNASAEHDLPGWLSRWMMLGWNLLAGRLVPEPGSYDEPQVQRGAYLARALGHCGECHTPRNGLGMMNGTREFAGYTMLESEAEPIDGSALDEWTEEDFEFFLFLGIKPDGEFVGGEMESVIEHNTSRLTEADRAALAAFFVRGQATRE
jgi:mono/diheme cytochrome c family protein